MADYPQRESHFAHRFVRLLTKTASAQVLGPNTCWMLSLIAHQEDSKWYTGPVTFWNDQLINICGFGGRSALVLARKKAIDAGWLHYEQGGKGKVGKYWVLIPDQFDALPDGTCDEDPSEYVSESRQDNDVILSESRQDNDLPVRKRTANGLQTDCKRTATGLQTDDKRTANGLQHDTILPNPIPNPNSIPIPIPIPKKIYVDQKCSTALSQNDVGSVVEHYRIYHQRAKPGEKEKAIIRARLNDGYSVDDLKSAIDGCHRSPFHCGENPGGKKYQSLELIVRDSSHVNQFLEVPRDGEEPVLSERTRRTMRAVKAFVEQQEESKDEQI